MGVDARWGPDSGYCKAGGEAPSDQESEEISGSRIQYGCQASLLLTKPHFRHTKFELFQRLKTSVLNRPSQQVRRESAPREQFSGSSRLGRSTGKPRKSQESCQTAEGADRRRERITLKLAKAVVSKTSGFSPFFSFQPPPPHQSISQPRCTAA